MDNINELRLGVNQYIKIRDILLFIANAGHKVTVKELMENVSDSSYAVTRRTVQMMYLAGLIIKHGSNSHPSYTVSEMNKEIYGSNHDNKRN